MFAVEDPRALSLKSYDVGATKTWVHVPNTDSSWSLCQKSGVYVAHAHNQGKLE